ncbi:hypothetical protein Tco_1062318 [Tanacetum coccineum]
MIYTIPALIHAYQMLRKFSLNKTHVVSNVNIDLKCNSNVSVTNVKPLNASKASNGGLCLLCGQCLSCGQCLFGANHDKCITQVYVNSRAKNALVTKSTIDKPTVAKSTTREHRKFRKPSEFIRMKAKTSRSWQKWSIRFAYGTSSLMIPMTMASEHVSSGPTPNHMASEHLRLALNCKKTMTFDQSSSELEINRKKTMALEHNSVSTISVAHGYLPNDTPSHTSTSVATYAPPLIVTSRDEQTPPNSNDLTKAQGQDNKKSQEKDTIIRKLKERIKSLSGNINKDKVKKDIEEIETINIELDHGVSKLIAKNEHLKQTYKQLYDSIKPTRIRSKEQCDALINQVNQKSREISDLNVSLQEKGLVITALEDELRKLKGKDLVDNVITENTIALEMLKIDEEPISPRLLNNRTTHLTLPPPPTK